MRALRPPAFGPIALALVLTALAAPAAPSLAAESRLDQATRRCVFRDSLEVGASVTGKVGQVIPVYALFEQWRFGVEDAYYNSSPSSLFLHHYRTQDPEYDPRRRPRTYRAENLAHAITTSLPKAGTGQVDRMLDGDRREAFDRASIVLGVDLFYWDAIWGLCGYGNSWVTPMPRSWFRKEPKRMDTEYQIQRLIARARASKKVLVLGTVPEENPDKVIINSRRTGKDGFWYPQQYGCVRSINATLRQHCRVEQNCYLVELGKLVEELNADGKISVRKFDREIGLNEARPDGVHLSFLGSQGLAERMIEQFEAHPPACGEGNGGSSSAPRSAPDGSPLAPAGASSAQ